MTIGLHFPYYFHVTHNLVYTLYTIMSGHTCRLVTISNSLTFQNVKSFARCSPHYINVPLSILI